MGRFLISPVESDFPPPLAPLTRPWEDRARDSPLPWSQALSHGIHIGAHANQDGFIDPTKVTKPMVALA